LEKLAASGEHHSIAARHASHLSQLSENNRGNPFDLEASTISGRRHGTWA
jgi:hypothetical protein